MTKDDETWEEVVKDVKPLKNNRFVQEIEAKEVPIRSDKVTTVTFDVLTKFHSVEKDDFSQMDGSLAKRFKREEFRIEAVLDLHRMTEKSAFDEVCDFIKSAYNQGKRCVLIVTGKGYDEALFSEKGVLRKSVPNWLSHTEISSLILAYKNPSEAKGGVGALYILLRKKV